MLTANTIYISRNLGIDTLPCQVGIRSARLAKFAYQRCCCVMWMIPVFQIAPLIMKLAWAYISRIALGKFRDTHFAETSDLQCAHSLIKTQATARGGGALVRHNPIKRCVVARFESIVLVPSSNNMHQAHKRCCRSRYCHTTRSIINSIWYWYPQNRSTHWEKACVPLNWNIPYKRLLFAQTRVEYGYYSFPLPMRSMRNRKTRKQSQWNSCHRTSQLRWRIPYDVINFEVLGWHN